MKIKNIDGLIFEKMVKNGLANLQRYKKQINEMNVFPVTDGDTGTNMCLTLANGIRHAKSNPDLGAYMKQLSYGMLLGARGNSGVILSQIFKGFYQSLSSQSDADAIKLKEAFISGYESAYQSVTHPVEGTILTVAREGIEKIKHQIDKDSDVQNLFSMYLSQMRATLAETPEMLPVLKEAGVVDSGGMGYILLVEGMSKSLLGEEIVGTEEILLQNDSVSSVNNMAFDENSSFDLGYCMEFLLQLIKNRKAFDRDEYTKELGACGDSLVCVKNDSIVKVHIHTKQPSRIIEISQQYGEFISFKLENMQLQHNELMLSASKTVNTRHKPLAIIAITNGDGIAQLFEEFGCDVIIDGGMTMNTSAEEILNAVKSVSADKIVIFPNHENIVKSAEQALRLEALDNVMIIPTEDVVGCYYALAMDNGGDDSTDDRIEAFIENSKLIDTASVTECVKDCVCNGVEFTKGEYVMLHKSKPCACVGSYDDAIRDLMKNGFFEDKETCIVFIGGEAENFDQYHCELLIGEQYPDMEISFVEGNQRIYDLIIGVV